MVHEDAGLFSVLCASAPATLNQLAAPIAMALQLAMFGHYLPAEFVAAWIAVGTTVQFVASLANFLLVVSMARVSHALGAEDWAVLGSTVRYALVAACTVGIAAAALLLLLRSRVLALMGLTAVTAAAYYVLGLTLTLPKSTLLYIHVLFRYFDIKYMLKSQAQPSSYAALELTTCTARPSPQLRSS